MTAHTDGHTAGTDDTEAAFSLSFRPILNHLDVAVFILDTNHDIVIWNAAIEQLTGHSEAEAKSMEMASQAFYNDGRRGKTLADKVLDAPESADEEYDVPRIDDVDYTLYGDTSTMLSGAGIERHIRFTAAPLYEDGDLVGVVEMVEDRTEEVEEHAQLEGLVTELTGTMEQMAAGDLSARASIDEDSYLDDEILQVVDAVNDMAEQLENTV